MAKFGIALEWGSRGLEFESQHSDQKIPQTIVFQWPAEFFYFLSTLLIATAARLILEETFKNQARGNPAKLFRGENACILCVLPLNEVIIKENKANTA